MPGNSLLEKILSTVHTPYYASNTSRCLSTSLALLNVDELEVRNATDSLRTNWDGFPLKSLNRAAVYL